MDEIPLVKQTGVWRIDSWFPELSSEIRNRLKAIFEDLNGANRALSLVPAKNLSLADVIYFADAIVAGRLILEEVPTGGRLVDFGSASGFPSLVLAVLSPGHKFLSIELDPKKGEYLRSLASRLKIGNFEVAIGAVDSVLPMGSVEWGLAKGFPNISRAILSLRKCFKTGGSLYHFRGEQWSMEVGEIPTQLCSVWSPALVGEYKLPIGAVKFSVVKTLKIQK